MDICKVIAERSTCAKIKTASIVVLNNNILSIGYNGVPSGIQHCADFWSERGFDDVYNREFRTRHREWSARFEIHAEINAIVKAPREITGATLYTVYSPCINCAKCIVSTGIKKVVYAEQYNRDFVDTRALFNAMGITFEKVIHI
jgi:dCMP deaminase